MKVQRLKIESFRGIDNLTLNFEPNVNVLLGINGVGKSSLLDCLAILLSILGQEIKRYLDIPEAFGNLYLKQISEKQVSEVYRTFNVFHERDIKNTKDYTNNEISISENERKTTWNGWSFREPYDIDEYAASSFNRDIAAIQSLERLILERFSVSRVEMQASIPVLAYYSINRTVDDPTLEAFDDFKLEKQSIYNDVLDSKTDFNNFFRWFRTLEDLENEENRDNPGYRDQHLEAVRQAIHFFLPDFSNLRVYRRPIPRMVVSKGIGEQKQELVINQLSDGEKCLLAMVGDLARRLAIANPGFTDPLQGEGVVLIDEIELHLHPQWQRKIIPCLTNTFPNCQFIVTTHSPQVISHVEADNIYILESTAEGIKAVRPEYSFGRDSNTILEDLMDVPSRPQKTQNQLQELFRLIEVGDLVVARQRIEELASEIGPNEAELASARAAIRRKEVLGR